MEIRTVDPQDELAVRRHWEIGKAAEADRPYDFYVPWPVARRTALEGREDRDFVYLGAFEDDRMWGAGIVDLSRIDNLHLANGTYHVHPERRRRGLGRALAEASYDVARGEGRRLLLAEVYTPVDDTSVGVLFAQALGFTEALVDGMKVVDLNETERTWAALEAASAPRHEDYRLVTWRDRVPDELLAGYCSLNEMFFDEAPTGELEVERERWDAERVRRREAGNLGRGRVELCAGALAADGSLVGWTEVGVNQASPWRGIQSGTLVAPAHRGHALGIAIKLANHRQLRREVPECELLLTGNADVNASMNAVNDALGYREVERCIEMQRAI